MKIFLNNIQLHARHGVMPQELAVGSTFLVSVEAEFCQEKATWTDDLADTLNYADMASIVREEMATSSQLLEHVAGRIGRHLLRHFPTLSHVTVRVTKQAPPIVGLQCEGAGVEVTISNEKEFDSAT